MQTNKVIQSLPRRLLFYFAPLFFLPACGVAVVIGYLGSFLLFPFTHYLIMIGSLIGSFLYFLFTGVMFAAFTYVVVVAEKSQIISLLITFDT